MSNLIRFNPFTEVSRFDPLPEFDSLFERFARTPLRPLWRGMEDVEPQIRMEISETGTEYLVKADLPGVKKDDIHVSIDGNTVTISAEVKHEKETKEGNMLLCSERSYGTAMRSFWLDHEVMDDKAKAKYADGVLELRLPKKSVSPHKEVAIS